MRLSTLFHAYRLATTRYVMLQEEIAHAHGGARYPLSDWIMDESGRACRQLWRFGTAIDERLRAMEREREGRVCPHCDRWKPHAGFYANRSWCKACLSAARHEYNITARRRLNKRYQQMNVRRPPPKLNEGRVCSKCGKWKPYTEFFRSNSQKSGYTSRCKKCYMRYEYQPKTQAFTGARVQCAGCGYTTWARGPGSPTLAGWRIEAWNTKCYCPKCQR